MDKFVVLSDFDGTVSQDLNCMIYAKFASVGMYYADLWELGEISTPEEIKLTFETITASHSEIADEIRKADFDPHFVEFVRLCIEKGLEVAIVSDGLEWSIETVLSKHGVPKIDIYANQIFFEEDGFRFAFPWRDERYPHAGVCKPLVIKKFHAEGKRVIYIGDGRSDHDAIHDADVVYAKDQLLAYCQAENVPAIAYQNFNNLVDAIKSNNFPPMMS
jgi:2,3-diketo-5-methylthio-1-phosphopentane phosphatase